MTNDSMANDQLDALRPESIEGLLEEMRAAIVSEAEEKAWRRAQSLADKNLARLSGEMERLFEQAYQRLEKGGEDYASGQGADGGVVPVSGD